MEKIFKNLTQLIGNTPLVELPKFETKEGVVARIVAKVESFNPGGSVKDRVGLAMIEQAEKQGKIKAGATLIEPTSGNTGVGLALVSAIKGYKLILTMPETMSMERRLLLKALGAHIVLTPGKEGMPGAIREAERIHNATAGSFIPSQFDNPANPNAHKQTTAQEIWCDTDGKVDIFIAGVGSGGTVSGVGAALKAYNPDIKVIAVEPAESAVLSGEPMAPHKIQGIGAGFVPANFDRNVVDEIIKVKGENAMITARELAITEGVLSGISSGAALSAAVEVAKRLENRGKMIVVLLPDTGERYLSTELYSQQ